MATIGLHIHGRLTNHKSNHKSNLGASIVDPTTKTTTHKEIKAQQERHTINKAELAAITTTLDLYKHAPILSILTDSAFSINNLKN